MILRDLIRVKNMLNSTISMWAISDVVIACIEHKVLLEDQSNWGSVGEVR